MQILDLSGGPQKPYSPRLDASDPDIINTLNEFSSDYYNEHKFSPGDIIQVKECFESSTMLSCMPLLFIRYIGRSLTRLDENEPNLSSDWIHREFDCVIAAALKDPESGKATYVEFVADSLTYEPYMAPSDLDETIPDSPEISA